MFDLTEINRSFSNEIKKFLYEAINANVPVLEISDLRYDLIDSISINLGQGK